MTYEAKYLLVEVCINF